MTEFWVSQGNKWCDFCKIYISNNSASIRTHELGTRHKENVAKKLAGIRKDNAVKEKEKLLAQKDLEKIESQAKKSYERDLASMRGDVPVGKQATQAGTNDTKRPKNVAQGSSGAFRVGKPSKVAVASSLELSKRKRVEKTGSKAAEEEAAALAARESALKRVKKREETLLGLYQH
jgi:hypothetical protein